MERHVTLHLKNLKLADKHEVGPKEVEMLIGLDNYWRVVTGGVIKGKDGPVAIASKFGYILSGPTSGITVQQVRPSINMLVKAMHIETTEEGLNEKLEKFWELESIGIKNEETTKENFYGKIHFLENRYVVSLPWKDDHALLGDNYGLAEKKTVFTTEKIEERS